MSRPAGKTRNWCAVAALLLLVAAAAGYLWQQKNLNATGEEKSIVVQVIHGDGTTKEFDLTTEREFLGPALVDGGVVEENQGAYGLYILTADGETAEEAKQQWWCLTKGGESIPTGADSTPIADGDRFELTLTTGY